MLSELKARAKDEEAYASFWSNFGSVLKEGAWDDNDNRREIAPLLRFRSSAVESLTALPDYVARMKAEQEAIYYLTGDDAAALAQSPQLEGFQARGIEVLLLSDHVDAFWPDRMREFEDKKLRSVTQAGADLGKFTPDAMPEGERVALDTLLPRLREALKDQVSDVRETDRLVDSAAVLAATEHGPDLQMQRMLRRAGRAAGGSLPVLEVNPHHALLRKMAAHEGEIAGIAGTLLDLARVQDGDAPRDPAGFARRLANSLAASLE